MVHISAWRQTVCPVFTLFNERIKTWYKGVHFLSFILQFDWHAVSQHIRKRKGTYMFLTTIASSMDPAASRARIRWSQVAEFIFRPLLLAFFIISKASTETKQEEERKRKNVRGSSRIWAYYWINRVTCFQTAAVVKDNVNIFISLD